MITKFKIYETNKTPQIGDYVILEPFGLQSKEIVNFYVSHIGQIKDIETRSNGEKVYNIIYDEMIPIQGTYDCNQFITDIKYFGSKDEMDLLLQANKYNL